ncbi:MAG: ParB/RepB/Spo0J family partition protein [Candidatus Nanohaloarchaea archaeon]
MTYDTDLEYIAKENIQYLKNKQEENIRIKDSLRADVGENGIITPLVVREVEDGYEAVDGNKRLKLAKLQGIDEVPCSVLHDCSEEEAKGLNITLNKLQEDPEPEDVLDVFIELREQGHGKERLRKIFGETVFDELISFARLESKKKETEFELDEFDDNFFPEEYIEAPPFPVVINFQLKEKKEKFRRLLHEYDGETSTERARNMVDDLCNSENAQKQVVKDE